MESFRIERDSMGEVRVSGKALYGASTQRAVENFPVSGLKMPESFISALGMIKRACARTNVDLGLLDPNLGKLIINAANEVAIGLLNDHFPVDIFQTGSGTSTNMNVNEVIASRCNFMSGHAIGSGHPVHPNDHVNMGQSSNDIIPTALQVSTAQNLHFRLIPNLRLLENELNRKSAEYADIYKLGRTHLMDAVPMTMGQQFSGYAGQVEVLIGKIDKAVESLKSLPVGGTAIGTGLNTHPDFASRVCKVLAGDTGIDFFEADNHFAAQSSLDEAVFTAGVLTSAATVLKKIASDVRLMASGPRAGLNEINLPAIQPGSSIMPGKVNPVLCESVIQTAHYVTGLCHTVVLCGQDGHFQLNANMPLTAYSLLRSIHCLNNVVNVFTEKCISGISANESVCRSYIDNSLMTVTALNGRLGYEKAAEVAKKAFEENKNLKDVLLEMKLLEKDEIEKLLNTERMV